MHIELTKEEAAILSTALVFLEAKSYACLDPDDRSQAGQAVRLRAAEAGKLRNRLDEAANLSNQPRSY